MAVTGPPSLFEIATAMGWLVSRMPKTAGRASSASRSRCGMRARRGLRATESRKPCSINRRAASLVGVDAQKMVAEMTANAEKNSAAIVAKANEDAAKIKATAQEEAETERNKALADLRSQVVTLSMAAANKLIGASMDEQRQRAE